MREKLRRIAEWIRFEIITPIQLSRPYRLIDAKLCRHRGDFREFVSDDGTRVDVRCYRCGAVMDIEANSSVEDFRRAERRMMR